MEEYKHFVGKQIIVFYDDGKDISRKDGFLESFNNDFLFLRTDLKTIGVAISRIVRIEVAE